MRARFMTACHTDDAQDNNAKDFPESDASAAYFGEGSKANLLTWA